MGIFTQRFFFFCWPSRCFVDILRPSESPRVCFSLFGRAIVVEDAPLRIAVFHSRFFASLFRLILLGSYYFTVLDRVCLSLARAIAAKFDEGKRAQTKKKTTTKSNSIVL